ncbi:DNA polymerase III subunit beta [Thermosynechococcus sp. QS41]|uniref:DNA polymerase III subunit beta n=1 Tax=Thermosynechococcus sp. QS41 TaxID=3074101 RepID=UPI002877EC70|nr:DNA polymerase III subunit beta [Thermosynechococcus sp. QS41]WNC59950.1 DNA polymerase III subunit beta [Thermosynechococcus sp. QS41]
MKVVCSQSVLSSKLAPLSRVAPSNPSHPILANILLQAEGGRLGLSVFDLSLGMQIWLDAEVKVPGAITVSAKLFSEMVARMPNRDIEITAEDTRVILDYGSGFFEIQGMSAEEFPALPTLEDVTPATLTAEALRRGLQGSLFAASTDETKQILTGLHVTFEVDRLEFAATDGHRLAVTLTEQPVPEALSPITIPAKSLKDLERLMAKQDGDVALRCDPTQVVFDIGNDARITSRLLEGQYPNYRQLIPKTFARQVTVERSTLADALERVAILAAQKNNVVKINIDAEAQELKLSAEAPQLGSGEENVPAQISGESMEVAFNVKYLLEGLKVMNSSEVQLQLNGETQPAILLPLGEAQMKYLVMPIQIRS